MRPKCLGRDIVGTLLLLVGCLIGGLVLNAMRPVPLPLVYSPPKDRLQQTAPESTTSVTVSDSLDRDIDLQEMQKISLNHGALIVDARSEKEYRAGHIPTAVNLPRAAFDQRSEALPSILQTHRNQPLIVYCSNFHCPDSQIVAAELHRMGYSDVRLFRGGWDEWQTAHLPEEKE